MDAASSTSPSICFIRLSSKEPEAFCSRAKTSIGLICIDVGESDQFCTLFLSSLPPPPPPFPRSRALSDTDNPTPSNTRSVSQITIAAYDRCGIGVSLMEEYAERRDINAARLIFLRAKFNICKIQYFTRSSFP